MDPTFGGVAAQLGLTASALLLLMGNPQFPPPTSGSGLGASWSSITAFAALWTATLANGYRLTNADLPVFNFAAGATTPVGIYYRGSSLADPLFDSWPP